MQLGDMLVGGEPRPKLLKALAVVAEHLHQLYNEQGRFIKDISKQSCVLCSLTVRDFLFKIGFHDAEVRPVLVAIRAFKGEEELHSLGIGNPDLRAKSDPKRWQGHMIVHLPSDRFVIDTTLYQAARPQWEQLPSMMVTPINRGHQGWGLESLASVRAELHDSTLIVQWFDQPKNKSWKNGPDALKGRREAVVAALVERFGKWEGD
ncbi:hypothetical protein [Mesorhizobium sp. SP-1A]|uniref:hypothetical protein n=1 Tax=Mesorhizobium sp. SP-1A TaxID=3077840 RepID=UPI0028F7091A|nr:hypothetical protein [Mesorhizobium sp. SP-1A]